MGLLNTNGTTGLRAPSGSCRIGETGETAETGETGETGDTGETGETVPKNVGLGD